MHVPGPPFLAAFLLAEVIPLAPLVAVWTPPIALTGFLSGLALRDLLAGVPGDVLGAEARWEIPQALGEFSTQPLVLLAASHYASSSSLRSARCRPFTERRSFRRRLVQAASSFEPSMNLGLECRCRRHQSVFRVVAQAK